MPFNFKKLFTPDKDIFSVSRIEALSDGVFSITMTLLILEIKVPPLTEDDTDTLRKLGQLIPLLENYFISFVVLGLFWVRHQMQFREIRKSDRNLMWINIFFLMFIAIIPFTTSIMVEYGNNHISIQVYSVNLIIVGLILILHWHYAISDHRLVDPSYNIKELHAVSRIQLVAPIIFTFSALIAFVDIQIAKMSLYILPLSTAVLFKVYKRIKTP